MGLFSAAQEYRSSISLKGDPETVDRFFGTRLTSSGKNVTPDTALRTSAVYCCISVLSETLASFPKHIKTIRPDGGKDIAPDHRLYRLINSRPNRWNTSFEFFEMMEGHRLLRGNAYARYVFNPGRQQNELVPMHPDHVFPFVVPPGGKNPDYLYDTSPPPEPGSTLWYQYFTPSGTIETLRSDEVLHVKCYSINGIVGLSPIKWALYQAVGLAMATEEHGGKLFSNGAQISTIIKHPKVLTQKAYDRLKGDFGPGGQFTGSTNAHGSIILEEGMDVAKIGMTAEESQFLESRRYQVEDIFRAYKVPLMLGAYGDKIETYASAEQFLTMFRVGTVAPNVKRWEEAFGRDLFYPSEVGKIEVDFDMDSLMRGDVAARAEYLKKRFEMASITPDQIRIYENENPTGKPEGQEYYLQSGMVPVRMAGTVNEQKVVEK